MHVGNTEKISCIANGKTLPSKAYFYLFLHRRHLKILHIFRYLYFKYGHDGKDKFMFILLRDMSKGETSQYFKIRSH